MKPKTKEVRLGFDEWLERVREAEEKRKAEGEEEELETEDNAEEEVEEKPKKVIDEEY